MYVNLALLNVTNALHKQFVYLVQLDTIQLLMQLVLRHALLHLFKILQIQNVFVQSVVIQLMVFAFHVILIVQHVLLLTINNVYLVLMGLFQKIPLVYNNTKHIILQYLLMKKQNIYNNKLKQHRKFLLMVLLAQMLLKMLCQHQVLESHRVDQHLRNQVISFQSRQTFLLIYFSQLILQKVSFHLNHLSS
ncbi:transmembrane protein, putative (macronuclear) [Tetrahymena thermophila SB210]|uniref:Transmembrane protein, putative n=1 Tax=Tetrahymena thermophila (strain SB210) TaxID=312017 RepID=W7X1D6_TETTS|nr:transmembrane protein, putative [Tetrahymena thermophila SB210]EWS71407.1 transmembrane protein, putative [Tetrahymena thermophila SB210]|eukprot:XP_012656059.1 transmembrane protein, putative [Tetrahymena thermophila SB210]